MNSFTVRDGTQIFYKDWGTGQTLFFRHGWPLSADDWDAQMMFFLERGFRVIAHDRKGHGRSTHTVAGNEMNTYAADVAELVEKLDLRDAIHIGHSTGGGEVARYVAKYGKGRVAKAVLISAVPPIMVKSEKNPGGPLRSSTRFARAQRRIGPSFTRTSRFRSTATTGREPAFLRAFGTTGGARA
jgi:non-heme chloroperoxidase